MSSSASFTASVANLISPVELKRHGAFHGRCICVSLESLQALIGYVYTQEHYGFPEDYWDRLRRTDLPQFQPKM